MKFLLQILFFLLTWLTTFANATPPAQKLAIPTYSISFSTVENQQLESEVKIGVENFARSNIIAKRGSQFLNSSSQKGVLLESYVLEKTRARVSVRVVQGAGKFTLQQIDDYVALATKQGNQSKVMLGKFEPNSPNSYISRAGTDHAYFDMGPTNWSQAESLVGGSVDEMWKINKKFIDNRKALGNDFYLSHAPTNPTYYKGFYKMEIDYLTTPISQGGLGGTMNNLGNNLWKVTW